MCIRDRIHADRLEYYQPEDLAKASGNVRVNQAGNVYEGPQLELKLETFEGFFNKVRYRFLASGGQGEAERVDFVDSNVSIARQGTYTTCRAIDTLLSTKSTRSASPSPPEARKR